MAHAPSSAALAQGASVHGGGSTHGVSHGASHATAPKEEVHQQHPLKVYFVIWGALFVLSLFSYLVDFFHVQGVLRWALILIFMMGKAGLIVAVFMHMVWERLALVYAILFPPVAILVFVAIMTFEADYTLFTRLTFFGWPRWTRGRNKM